MWNRSRTGEFLYSYESSEAGYKIIVTNLHRAWAESLTARQVEDRGKELQTEFVLNLVRQRAAFLEEVGKILGTDGAKFDLPEISVHTEHFHTPLDWQFHMLELSPIETIGVVKGLIEGLLGVVECLGVERNQRDQIIHDKDVVIKGLVDANQRRIDYRIPKHLESAFTSRTEPMPSPASKDPVLLASQLWPKSPAPVLTVVISRKSSAAEDERREGGETSRPGLSSHSGESQERTLDSVDTDSDATFDGSRDEPSTYEFT